MAQELDLKADLGGTRRRGGQDDLAAVGQEVLEQLRVLVVDLGDDLGVVPLPAGPSGDATPLTGIDGWYLNPNSTNQQAAIDFALFAFGPEGSKIYADVAGAPMGRTDIEISDPYIADFADIANAGFPRPQSKEFGGWWGAFDDAHTKVLEGAADAETAVTEACAAMNTANNK